MNHRARQIAFLSCALLGIGVFSAGCSSVATRKKFYVPITQSVRAHKFSEATRLLDEAEKHKRFAGKDRLLYYIDAGALYHYARAFDTSNQKLSEADQAADELYTKSVSRAVASLVINDNILEYAGEDYELIYINIIKALNYLALDDFDGAFVEIRRLNEKLDLLENKYVDMARDFRLAAEKDTTLPPMNYEAEKVRFFNDAFARYLSLHMYAAEGLPDDARIDHDLLMDAFKSQPQIYDFEPPPINYQPDTGVIVSVVALVGLAPEKEDVGLRIRTDKQLDLVQILYDGGGKDGQEYGHIPMKVNADYYFKFAIPKMVVRPSPVDRIAVLLNGEKIGQLSLIENVSSIATSIFDVKKPLIYLRSVARAVAKGLASHEAKEKLDTGGLSGWLKKAAVDVAQDVLENADLRTTQFLPGSIYVGDFDILPGTYDLTVEFYDIDGHLLGRNFIEQYTVSKSGLNLVEAEALYLRPTASGGSQPQELP